LGGKHRARSKGFWHTLTTPDKGDANLQTHRKLASRALGHTKIESTVRYLGIEVDDALAIAEQVDV
jgi:hypothetical protein